jgi:DNA-binding Lrp family transcriptional regulator
MTAQRARLVGQGAASRKYDVLTGLSCAGLRAQGLSAVLALRLIALITARYNWARDAASIGHEELARLWGVSRRTVIRDVDKLLRLGLLEVATAPRRGRVASYRLGHAAIDRLTRPVWDAAGPDFAARMAAPEEGRSDDGLPAEGRVVPLFPTPSGSGPWVEVLASLPPSVHGPARARWLEPLAFEAVEDDTLRLRAPSPFHADYAARTYGDALDRAARAVGVARRVIIAA